MGAVVAVAFGFTIVIHTINNLRNDNAMLRRDLQAQMQVRDIAEELVQNQAQIMHLFSAIRAENIKARAAYENQRDEAKQNIIATTTDACGNSPVSAAATGELQKLERNTRATSGFVASD